jgi:LAGLIDADG endonuclease
MSSKIELAWAAGFFDGEGCSYLQKTSVGHRRLRANITQKDIRPLERFQQVVGMGTIYGPRPQPPHTYYLYFNRRNSIALFELLWPYLSEPKREQWSRCVENEIRFKPKDVAHVF